MKKIYTVAFAFLSLLASQRTATAQVPNGSMVPNIVFNDIYGNPFNLYSYLDSGYSVVLDISAAWCNPCWSLHTSGTLETLWAQHGPAGMTGVSASTTDKVVVVYMEGESTNTTAQIFGTSTGNTRATFSKGDWTAGSDYIFLDAGSSNIMNFYQIASFPTTFVICPNRMIKETYTGYGPDYINVPILLGQTDACPVATFTHDASLLSYTGTRQTCDDVTVKVILQNMGFDPLTAATITATGGTTPLTYDWTGNLPTYGTQEVTIGTTTINSTTDLEIKITTPDGEIANNTVTQNVVRAVEGKNVVTVSITTDVYGNETKWTLKNSNGIIVMQGGPYAVDTTAFTHPQPDTTKVLPLDCYTFRITDEFGDGMCVTTSDGQTHCGSYWVRDNWGATYAYGNDFGTSQSTPMLVAAESGVGIEEAGGVINLALYPVPVTDEAMLTVAVNATTRMDYAITDILGREVARVENMSLKSGINKIAINTANLPDGVYMINVNDGGRIRTLKFNVAR